MRLPPRVLEAPVPSVRAAEPAPPARDLRLDFFRGLSLFFIFIDHIPENVFAYFTLHAVAFCDAAEVFIFISGYTAALVYGQSLRRSGPLFATAQIYRRVWQLYVAHVFLFVIFVAEVSYSLVALQNPMYTEEMGVGDFLNEPHVAVIHALLLDFQPPFLDILPLYIVLLGTFPIVLLGIEANAPLTCGASFILYALALKRGWALHTFPGNQAWYFNPLAWQFLFVIGAAFGHRGPGGGPARRVPRWITGAAVVVASGIAIIALSWLAHWIYDPIPPLYLKLWYMTRDKTNLVPLRLVSFLALAGATLHLVRPDSRFLGWRAARIVILCGQNSLYVFCLGIVLSLLGHFVLSDVDPRVGMQILVNLVGLALLMATAMMLQWYKVASRRRGPAAANAGDASE